METIVHVEWIDTDSIKDGIGMVGWLTKAEYQAVIDIAKALKLIA